jgi:hypothetical protein
MSTIGKQRLVALACAALLALLLTGIGCHSIAQPRDHDPRTDMGAAERKDKQGPFH